jgi:hypothetical protein
MNAAEAKILTTEALEGTAIECFVTYIDKRIKDQAEEGKSSINNPDMINSESGDTFYVGGDYLESLKKHYEMEGFKWVNHPDPDPGHPCSRAYITLEW